MVDKVDEMAEMQWHVSISDERDCRDERRASQEAGEGNYDPRNEEIL